MMSIGVQTGPMIGVQKGPTPGMAECTFAEGGVAEPVG
jgi:hypothetical protein